MTPEEKQLLLKDLCARLPYGIVISIPYPTLIVNEKSKKLDIPLISIDLIHNTCTVGDLYSETSGLRMFNRKGELLCKPYLRPISSMTEEEMDKMFDILHIDKDGNDEDWIKINDDLGIKFFFPTGKWVEDVAEVYDYLYSIHIDFRGMISDGLALPAQEGMYNTKTE